MPSAKLQYVETLCMKTEIKHQRAVTALRLSACIRDTAGETDPHDKSYMSKLKQVIVIVEEL